MIVQCQVVAVVQFTHLFAVASGLRIDGKDKENVSFVRLFIATLTSKLFKIKIIFYVTKRFHANDR